MARRARRARDEWPLRDAHCPMRGAALSHVVDGTDQCVYCDRWTRERDTPLVIEDAEGHPVPFTDEQVKTYEFYQYLYREGKV